MELLAFLLAAMLGLMAIGVPIAFAILAGGIATLILFIPSARLMIVPQQLYGGIDSFTLLAIPCFLLAGSLMTEGGLTRRLIGFANAVMGRFRGGLALSNILAAGVFAGISGSAVADTSALGRVMIPAMIREGYAPGFAAAVNASANVMAPIIPPSIAFIVLGVLTGQSITRLFVAGIVIGLIYGLAMITIAALIAARRNHPVHAAAGWAEIAAAFRDALPALAMPVLIIAGIRTGIFNVTECSAVAVLYALFSGAVLYRELGWRELLAALVSTARTTAVIMIIVGSARLFSWILGYAGLPARIAAFLLEVAGDRLAFLLLVNLVLLVVGMFLEANAALIMLVPVLFPTAQALGLDQTHLSVVVVVNLCIGLLTPPVGLTLNLSALIAEVPLAEAIRESAPFIGLALLVLALLTYVPGLASLLPDLVLGGG
jgi:tripartite ATP-independent transporter DctM subunit